jgi:hypothetical protein
LFIGLLEGARGDRPNSEIVTATTVTTGNAGDAEPAGDLLADDPSHRHRRHRDTDTADGGAQRPVSARPTRATVHD